MPKSKNNRKGKERKNRKRNLERYRKQLKDVRTPANIFAKRIKEMQAAASISKMIQEDSESKQESQNETS